MGQNVKKIKFSGWWHKSQRIHANIYNIARKDLLMHSRRTPTTRVKIARETKWA